MINRYTKTEISIILRNMKYIQLCALLLVIIGVSNDLVGCSCGIIPATHEYEYVALVEITGVLKSDLYEPGEPYEPPKNKDQPVKNVPNPFFHEVKIKTIEQFIGKKQEFVVVHGGNEKYNLHWSSCDIGLGIGEKWIIYGKKFKKEDIHGIL